MLVKSINPEINPLGPIALRVTGKHLPDSLFIKNSKKKRLRQWAYHIISKEKT